MLQKVKSIWEKITGEDAGGGFMVFKDREGIGEEDGGEEDEL